MVLHIGVEGGSLIVWSQEYNGVRRFYIERDECVGEFVEEESSRQFRRYCQSWTEVIQLLPHTWHQFYPLQVSPRYAPLMIMELRNHGIEPSHEMKWKGVFKQ